MADTQGIMHDPISQFSKPTVQARIAGLGLENGNQALLDRWFSLWNGDALPTREQFGPAKIKPFLPSILVFDVVPEESVTARLAGTAYRYILGSDPTGLDWIAAAPENHRETRLRIFSAVARGAVLVAHRRIGMLAAKDIISEEILFPLAARASGSVPVIVHLNLTHKQVTAMKSITQVTGDPIDTRLVTFV
ncbi:MAG TPA: PAS domain-containing protein [Rhizomicrobium sp.]|jgi:hypothetical protein|nr:PAS domain-containing protein [Rhizomicrobium sp.]